MNTSIEFLLNEASSELVAEHLLRCDSDFMPPLSDRVEINDYAKKITSSTTRFEAWSGGMLVGLVAAYCNDHVKRTAYITNVSRLTAWRGKGIASHLMNWCVEYVKALGMLQISLEVASDNKVAIELYERIGFVAEQSNSLFVTMNIDLEYGE